MFCCYIPLGKPVPGFPTPGDWYFTPYYSWRLALLHGPPFLHRPPWHTTLRLCPESWYVLPLCINVINYWSPVLWAEQSFCACVVKRIGLDTSQLLHQHSTRKDALPLFSVSPLTACYLSHAVCRYLSISAISPSIHLCDCSTDSLLEFSRL